MKVNFTSSRIGASRALAKSLLLAAIFTSAADLDWLTPPLQAADRRWTGAASVNWSNPNNWIPAGIPQNGDSLLFYNDNLITSSVNDLVDLVVTSVSFAEADHTISGNPLTITSPTLSLYNGHNFVTGNPSYSTTINCPLVFPNGGEISTGGAPGTIFEKTEHLYLRGQITINSGRLTFRSYTDDAGPGGDGDMEVTGEIAGTGDLLATVDGNSSLGFNGAVGNSFTGTLTVRSRGGAYVGFHKTAGSVVNDHLHLDGPGAVVRLLGDDQIGDNAIVSIAGPGQFLLQGHTETIGSLSLTNFGGEVDAALVDTGGSTLSVQGDVTAVSDSSSARPTIKGLLGLPSGGHTFTVSGAAFYALDVPAQITGAGGFNKFGDAALLLRTNNTFAGSMFVGEGIVEARHAQAFGSTTRGVTLGDGSITLNNVIVHNEALFIRGTRAVTANTAGSLLSGIGFSGWQGQIELDTNLVVNSSDLCVLGGPINGPGGLEFLGSRNQIVGSGSSLTPSTFTGTTRVLSELLVLNEEHALRGPLIVGGGFSPLCEVQWDFPSLNTLVPEVTVHPNGLVNLNGRNQAFTELIFHGGRVITGAGTLEVRRVTTNPTNVTASIEGNLLLGSGPMTEFIVPDGPATPDLAISAIVADGPNTVGINKLGNGELLLSGANTYDGVTRVSAGVLHIQNITSLGTTGADTTVLDGGTLKVELVSALAEPLNLRGAGRGGEGALDLLAATGVQAGIVLDADATVRNDVQFAILSGVISGPGGLTKVGAGALQLGGGSGAANTYGGDTLVSEGEVVLSKPSAVAAVPGHLIIGSGGGGISVPATTVRQFNSSQIIGSVTVNRGGLWNLNGFSETFSVAALQGRPPITLNGGGDVQTGAGTLQLPLGGDVVVDPGGVPLASSVISGNLGLEPGPHRFIVQSGRSIIGVDVPELDISAVINQPLIAADIVKEGPGEMRLSGNNSFTGVTTVNAGALTIAHAHALGTTAGGTFVNSNAVLVLDGGFEVTGETLTLASTNAAAFLSLDPVTNTWSGNIVLQRTAGIRVTDAGGALTHFGGVSQFDSSAISGPGGFTKSGPGTLFITGLTGGNSYTGPTTVTDGLLQPLRRNSLSTAVLVTGTSATLRTAGATGLFPNRTVLPAGVSVTVQNGALWSMTPTNSETIGRLLGDGRLDIGSGAALTVSNSVSCTFSGIVTGSGALNKRGLATLGVTGQSPSYSGPATVFDGTYEVDGYFGASPVTVKNSSILRGSGAVGDVTVENGGAVRVDPRNPGVLGGAMQFNSANFHAGGVLAAQFFGPHPTAGNDFLYVLNGVTLSNSAHSFGFLYPPHEGDVITVVQKIAAGAITGAFSGFPEGALRMIGQIPVVASYVGGNGNDMTLTVTNLPLQSGGSQLLSGYGGSALVPSDCSLFSLVVTNRSATTLSNLHGTLRSLTEGVLVTRAESDFSNLAPNARGTNATPFQIRTEPTFACGGGAQLELVLTGSNIPPIAIPYTLTGASGYALDFDGRNGQVDAPANSFAGMVNNFTIELWANPAGNRTQTAETNAGISGVSVPLRQLQCFAVFPDRGNFAYGVTHVGAGLSIGRNGISAYEQGTNHLPSRLVYSNALSGWTHVALVYANRQPRLYVNGALVRSGSASLFANVHPSASLGGSVQADYGNFDGQLDEVRIWNVARSQTQIQTDMSHGLAGNESGLVVYFRCDEGSGSALTDSAPASPNPTGTLTDGAAFVFPGVVPFSQPGVDCNSGGGACESCLLVSGTFTTNTPTLAAHLQAALSPSLCSPARPCPGAEGIPGLPPTRFIQHAFSNATTQEVCATAQMRFDCPVAPQSALHVAAYLGAVDPNDPCRNYLGDSGGDGTAPFSFRVPTGSNVVLLVTQRVPDFGCDTYTLELFGLPCPPPRLDIARDAGPGNIRVSWSSAYPDFRLQSVNSLGGPGPFPFAVSSNIAVLLNSKFSVTNATTAPHQFFRLESQ